MTNYVWNREELDTQDTRHAVLDRSLSHSWSLISAKSMVKLICWQVINVIIVMSAISCSVYVLKLSLKSVKVRFKSINVNKCYCPWETFSVDKSLTFDCTSQQAGTVLNCEQFMALWSIQFLQFLSCFFIAEESKFCWTGFVGGRNKTCWHNAVQLFSFIKVSISCWKTSLVVESFKYRHLCFYICISCKACEQHSSCWTNYRRNLS